MVTQRYQESHSALEILPAYCILKDNSKLKFCYHTYCKSKPNGEDVHQKPDLLLHQPKHKHVPPLFPSVCQLYVVPSAHDYKRLLYTHGILNETCRLTLREREKGMQGVYGVVHNHKYNPPPLRLPPAYLVQHSIL